MIETALWIMVIVIGSWCLLLTAAFVIHLNKLEGDVDYEKPKKKYVKSICTRPYRADNCVCNECPRKKP